MEQIDYIELKCGCDEQLLCECGKELHRPNHYSQIKVVHCKKRDTCECESCNRKYYLNYQTGVQLW